MIKKPKEFIAFEMENDTENLIEKLKVEFKENERNKRVILMRRS